MEIAEIEEKLPAAEEELKVLLIPKDPNDEKNVILEIRAGTGGDEATLFAAEILRMYARYAERQGWKMEILDASDNGVGGIKDAIAMIEGDNVYSKMRFESGVHRVQRVPQTETQGRIHTSAITVAVLPEAEEVDVQIDQKTFASIHFCSSGPGGQSVNTTYSAVRITHLPTNVVVSMQDEKSQIKNSEKAMRVLRARLQELEEQKQHDAMSAERKSMVGSGDRSEKIRTYNFKENRVTDHRIGLTVHQLDLVMEGQIDEFIEALQTHYQTEKLRPRLSQLKFILSCICSICRSRHVFISSDTANRPATPRAVSAGTGRRRCRALGTAGRENRSVARQGRHRRDLFERPASGRRDR